MEILSPRLSMSGAWYPIHHLITQNSNLRLGYKQFTDENQFINAPIKYAKLFTTIVPIVNLWQNKQKAARKV